MTEDLTNSELRGQIESSVKEIASWLTIERLRNLVDLKSELSEAALAVFERERLIGVSSDLYNRTIDEIPTDFQIGGRDFKATDRHSSDFVFALAQIQAVAGRADDAEIVNLCGFLQEEGAVEIGTESLMKAQEILAELAGQQGENLEVKRNAVVLVHLRKIDSKKARAQLVGSVALLAKRGIFF